MRPHRSKISTINARGLFLERFCTPTSSIEYPMYKTSLSCPRRYCVLGRRDKDDYAGHGVEYDDTSEMGRLQSVDDVFGLLSKTATLGKSAAATASACEEALPRGKTNATGIKDCDISFRSAQKDETPTHTECRAKRQHPRPMGWHKRNHRHRCGVNWRRTTWKEKQAQKRHIATSVEK